MSAAPTHFTDRDAKIVDRVRGVDANCYMIYRTSIVTYKNIDAAASVTGMVPSLAEDTFIGAQGYDVESGRFLEDRDTCT